MIFTYFIPEVENTFRGGHVFTTFPFTASLSSDDQMKEWSFGPISFAAVFNKDEVSSRGGAKWQGVAAKCNKIKTLQRTL